jgi:hypothetical protein
VEVSTVDLDPSKNLATVHFDEHSAHGATHSPLSACLRVGTESSHVKSQDIEISKPGVEEAGSLVFGLVGKGTYYFRYTCSDDFAPDIYLFNLPFTR